MPYLNDYQRDEEDLPSASGVSSVISDTGSPTRAGTMSAPTVRAPSKSGAFVDLNKYLDMNQQGAESMGNKIAGNLNQTASKVGSDIDKTATEVGKAVDASTVGYNQNTVNQAISNPTGDLTDVTKMLNASYTGPTTARSTGKLGDLDQAVAKAVEQANLFDTWGGTQELVNQIAETPRTIGSRSLDSFLVRQTAPASTAITTAASALKPITETYKTAEQAMNDRIKAAAQTTSETANKTREELVKGVGNFQSDITAKLLAAREAESAKQNALKAALQKGTALSPQQLQMMGVTQDQWNALSAMNAKAKALGEAGLGDLTPYLSQASADVIGRNNIVSAEQAAKYAALANLAGVGSGFVDPNGLGSVGPLSAFNLSQAQNALNSMIMTGEQKKAAAAQLAAQQQAAAQQAAQLAAAKKAAEEQAAAQQAAYQQQLAQQQQAAQLAAQQAAAQQAAYQQQLAAQLAAQQQAAQQAAQQQQNTTPQNTTAPQQAAPPATTQSIEQQLMTNPTTTTIAGLSVGDYGRKWVSDRARGDNFSIQPNVYLPTNLISDYMNLYAQEVVSSNPSISQRDLDTKLAQRAYDLQRSKTQQMVRSDMESMARNVAETQRSAAQSGGPGPVVNNFSTLVRLAGLWM